MHDIGGLDPAGTGLATYIVSCSMRSGSVRLFNGNYNLRNFHQRP